MKRVLWIGAIALSLIGCKNDVNRTTTNPYDPSVTGTCVSADAPQWAVVGDLALSQMSIIVDQFGVPTTMQDGDQLAAFVGNSCRGLVEPFLDGSSKWRINLSVHTITGDDINNLNFQLRYYSAKEKGIYTSQSIQYVDDAILGSASKGYVPAWQ